MYVYTMSLFNKLSVLCIVKRIYKLNPKILRCTTIFIGLVNMNFIYIVLIFRLNYLIQMKFYVHVRSIPTLSIGYYLSPIFCYKLFYNFILMKVFWFSIQDNINLFVFVCCHKNI